MTPPPLLYMSDNGTDASPTSVASAASSGSEDDSRLSGKVIVRMVIALGECSLTPLCVLGLARQGAHGVGLLSYIVFFFIIIAIVGCVAWSRDRSHKSGTHNPQTRRRRGANTAQLPTHNDLRRQPSAQWVSPPPPYLPPAPSYTSLHSAPPYSSGSSSEEGSEHGIQMTTVGGSGSLPSLPLSSVSSRPLDTGRPRAPGYAAELQPPLEAHVARHGLE